MAGNDEELNKLDDLFDANDPDDMADFMSMLDSIDADGSGLEEELRKAETKQPETSEAAAADDTADIEEAMDDFPDIPDSEEPIAFNENDDLFNLTDEEKEESDKKVQGMMSELGLSDLDSLAEPPLDETELAVDEGGSEPAGTEIPVQDAVTDSDGDISSFVPAEEDNILDLLDAVGDDTVKEDKSPEDIADESVGELADIFASFDGEMTEPEADLNLVEKKSLFRRMIERFKKNPTEEELLERQKEEEEERLWEEQKAAEAQEKKAESEAKKQEKKAESEAKKQAQKEKRAAAKAAKEERKAEKQAQKEAARGPIPRSQLVPVKPVLVFVIIGIALGVTGVLFTNYRFYNSSVSQAKEQFIHQKYRKAYELLEGLDIKKKDETFYEQVKTIRIVDKDLDAYNNYIDAGNYEMALDSLVQGIGKYGIQSEKAKELNLDKEMHALYESMVQELTVRFSMTARDAENLYQFKDQEDYQKQIVQFARDAAIRDGVLEPLNITGSGQ